MIRNQKKSVGCNYISMPWICHRKHQMISFTFGLTNYTCTGQNVCICKGGGGGGGGGAVDIPFGTGHFS